MPDAQPREGEVDTLVSPRGAGACQRPTMTARQAVILLGALGNETRLDVFRHLTRFGPEGVAAKHIAETLGMAPNSLSFHLKELKYAGLVVSHRAGREVRYAVDYEATHGLVAYLIEHCCDAVPDGCPPACRPAGTPGGCGTTGT